MSCQDENANYIKFGDTEPDLPWLVNRSLVGVTSATMFARREGTLNPIYTLPSSITNAAEGEVTYLPDGTLPEGTYEILVDIQEASGSSTAPSKGYGKLVVENNFSA